RLGRARCGDFLAQILSDAGAEVTSLESIDSPQTPANYRADVVINDLGQGAAAPAGFSAAGMTGSRAPKVYCTLVSFPAVGPQGLPELEDAPILALLGLNRLRPCPPQQEMLAIPSYYGALLAAILISCALMPRNRRERVTEVEVSLFAAALN